MNVDELLLSIQNVGFDSLVCQTDIQTEEDKQHYQKQGYQIYLTEQAFKDKFKMSPQYIWYTPSVSMSCLYFNPETLAAAPFHIEFFLVEDQEDMDGFFGIDAVYQAIERREKDVAQHDYMGSIMSLTDKMKLEYFKLLVDKKGKNIPDLYELFISFYQEADYGFSNIDKSTLETILNSKTLKEKQNTARKIKKLPDILTIYRGGNSASTDYKEAYSWTLDINTANFFAIRRGGGPAYIVKGEVSKKDIIEYFEDREEQEIIVDPSKVKVVEALNLKGMDFIEEVLPKVAPMYRKYKALLNDLKFHQASSIHGIKHTERVLLLTLFISEYLHLPMSDREILATAAIYHDTRRTHDWVEPEHGKAAKEYYHTNVANPDPLVEFLCEYHCLPDEQGYQEIQNNPLLSKNKDRVIQLFHAFKDADGLDRIRLGDIRNEMDMKQYRLPITKELTLVAKLCQAL